MMKSMAVEVDNPAVIAQEMLPSWKTVSMLNLKTF